MINPTLIKKLEPEYSINVFGKRSSFNSNGQRHSFYDYPAVIYPNGSEQWYKNGMQHRGNGLPAVICPGGYKEWWENDKFIRSE